MAKYITTDTELTSIANAIREKRATTFEELEKAKQFAFNREARDLDDKYESA